MTEHAPPTVHNTQAGLASARVRLGGPLIPGVWMDEVARPAWCECDHPLRGGEHSIMCRPERQRLRHQLQEFTDTTAAYEAGEDVTPGDCWRACLASLLEVPLAEVPHFIHLHPLLPSDPMLARDPQERLEIIQEQCLIPVRGPRWWRESVAWVEQQRPGWTMRAWDRPDESKPWPPFYVRPGHDDAPDRVILTAPSPRGAWNHSVLVDELTGITEHDPFPDGNGVLPGPGDVAALVRFEWLDGPR